MRFESELRITQEKKNQIPDCTNCTRIIDYFSVVQSIQREETFQQ